MTRVRLPDRRFAETVMLEHGGTRFMVTIGFYPDGRPGEVFTHGARSGSNLDALLADACVVVSCLIQHGAEPRELANSRGGSGTRSPLQSSARFLTSSLVRARNNLARRQAHDRRADAPARRGHHRRAGRSLRLRSDIDGDRRGALRTSQRLARMSMFVRCCTSKWRSSSF